MEIIGLTVGVAGLVTVCLDLIDRVENYRNCGADSKQLASRFEANKLRLREWAASVGIKDGKLTEDHNKRLDILEVATVIKSLLESLCEVFENAEQTREHLSLVRMKMEQNVTSWPLVNGTEIAVNKSKLSSGHIKGSFRWAMRGKNRFTSQVEVMESLLDKLYDIVPPNREDHLALTGLTGSSTQLIEYQRTIDFLVENCVRNATRKAFDGIDKWLDVANVDQQYDRHLADHLEGTCEWLLDEPVYQEWISTELHEDLPKVLWLAGPAGHGKTVMCAWLVKHLASFWTSSVIYFFSSNHVQAGGKLDGVIRTWLSEAIRKNETAFHVVNDSVEYFSNTRMASHSDIWTLFAAVTAATNDSIFVLDGFDEYSAADDGRKDFLQKLRKAICDTKTRCIITSRPEADIESGFHTLAVEGCGIFECKLNEARLEKDIAEFSKKVVEERLPAKAQLLKQELAADLALKSEGMFLWIKLQREHLRSGRSEKALRNIVKSMPAGLDQSYARNWMTIQNFEDYRRERAISILRWTVFAPRPLTISEMTEALVVELDEDSTKFPVDDMPSEIDDQYIEDELKSLCGSLIEIQPTEAETPIQYWTIQTIHVSAHQYLLSVLPTPLVKEPCFDLIYRREMQNAYLTEICLRCLNYTDLWEPLYSLDAVTQRAFLNYATSFWPDFASACGKSSTVLDGRLRQFFSPENPIFEKWAEQYESGQLESFEKANTVYESLENMEQQLWSGFYFASRFGFTSTMEFLRDLAETDINQKGRKYGTALQAVCRFGKRAAFDLLIDWESDVNVTAGTFGTALNAAAWQGEAQLVTILISKGAEVNVPDQWQCTPLRYACMNSESEVVALLLEAGADPNTPFFDNHTVLHIAAMRGSLDIIEELLKNGADLSPTDIWMCTPLMLAAGEGNIDVVKLLLHRGASYSAVSDLGATALHMAANSGHTEVVRELLSQGADPMQIDRNKSTPLHLAADAGHLEVVNLLLGHKYDVSGVDKDGKTPLVLAVQRDHRDIANALITHGADVLKNSEEDETVLLEAAARDNHLLVRKLLDLGADISCKDVRGWTPLFVASFYGNTATAEELIEHGADISAVAEGGFTPLIIAADYGHFSIVRKLLDCGVDPSIATEDGTTPLLAAIRKGDLSVVKELLRRGASPSCPTQARKSLVAAAGHGHIDIVKELLDAGADIDEVEPVDADKDIAKTHLPSGTRLPEFETAKVQLEVAKTPLARGASISNDQLVWTPLMAALSGGHLSIVKELLARGASISHPSQAHTPLALATLGGHIDFVRELLDSGADVEELSLNTGSNALSVAAEEGHVEIVKELLVRGASVSRHSQEWPPLVRAANRGYVDIIRALLDAGADVEQTSLANGLNALQYAAMGEDPESVEELLSRGANISARREEDTALRLAAMCERTGIIQILLQHGADPLEVRLEECWSLLRAVPDEGASMLKRLLDNESEVSFSMIHRLFGEASKVRALDMTRLILERLNCSLSQDDIDELLLNAVISGSWQIVKDVLKWGANAASENRMLESTHLNFAALESSETMENEVLNHFVRIIAQKILVGDHGKEDQTFIPLGSNHRRDQRFYQLGHCFVRLGRISKAVYAFQQVQLPIGISEEPLYDRRCYSCKACPIQGPLFICKVCIDVDLCYNCWIDGVLLSITDKLGQCASHEFLRIENSQLSLWDIDCPAGYLNVENRVWLQALVDS